ncbi:hypothetical protein [Rhodopseudomonas sp. P2A-2r]|uniref:hypothetical protein n=1 Tax=unclassified Rhodopseudomonas TaxID=2638247 RepID=UPI0022349711|nr:hypothetical protein [Rhodopseudomonas sp. P2A-2r]UZE48718.1 hypothetical protein ONR75_28845 [Rhodopseudomonas sp. P2A-2r]
MAQTKSTTRHNIVTRCLAAAAMVFVYCIGLVGASAMLLAASTTSADARGGGRGGGRGRGGGVVIRGGGFRGGGYRGRGRGYGFGPPIVAPGCYYSRRWGRMICPY